MSDNYFMGLDGFVWFTGVVEDRYDPDKLGRVRVRCLGYHTESKELIPTEDLPWAHVMHPVTDPSMQGMGQTPSFLVEGTWVVGFFMDSREKQQPIIMGTLPGVPESAPDTNYGFNDPTGEYPSTSASHGLGESDTNRLARNDKGDDALEHDVFTTKEFSNQTDVELPENTQIIGDSVVATVDASNTVDSINTPVTNPQWSEPVYTDKSKSGAPRYNTAYPLNHVFQSESGHIKEYDDTPDAERIHEYHKTGTYYEIDADGNKVTKVVGNNYEITAGTNFVYVRGDANLTIDSNCKTYIKGDWDIQVDGDVRETIKGTLTQKVTGAVTEEYGNTKSELVVGNVTETYQGNQIVKIGTTGSSTGGTLDMDTTTEIDLQSALINFNKGSTNVARAASVNFGIAQPGFVDSAVSFLRNTVQTVIEADEEYSAGEEQIDTGSDLLSTAVCGETPSAQSNPYDVVVDALKLGQTRWLDSDTKTGNDLYKKENPYIMALWDEIGYNSSQDWILDTVAWCAVFLGACLKRSGNAHIQTATARKYQDYGQEVWNRETNSLESLPRRIQIGDILVFYRSGLNSRSGHVGFYAGGRLDTTGDNRRIACLGGNQGNTLKVSNLYVAGSRSGLLSVRRAVSCIDKTTVAPDPTGQAVPYQGSSSGGRQDTLT